MDMSKEGFVVGQRVQISPGYDAWMRGDRFGQVVKVTAKSVHVKLDKSGRTLRVTRRTGIYEIVPGFFCGDGKWFASLEEARVHAAAVHRTTGNIIAIEARS